MNLTENDLIDLFAIVFKFNFLLEFTGWFTFAQFLCLNT